MEGALDGAPVRQEVSQHEPLHHFRAQASSSGEQQCVALADSHTKPIVSVPQVGAAVGWVVPGLKVGDVDGLDVGTEVVGPDVGEPVGEAEVGPVVGDTEGLDVVGAADGELDGMYEPEGSHRWPQHSLQDRM